MADKNSSKRIILKIAEAQSKDVGRAIARIDPEYFLKIQADTGDIIKLKVESEKHALEKHRGLKVKGQETVAKLMPTYQEDRGKGIAQIDGIARDNLGAGLDEKIEIYKTVCENARTVILTSLDSGDSFKEEDSQYLADILDGTPVIKGSKIRATFFGTKAQDFLVEDVEPDGAVVIKPSTLIKVKGVSKE
ncbi:MAG: hypothetical protein ABH813_01525, partial [Patescibacteria group bacterium]